MVLSQSTDASLPCENTPQEILYSATFKDQATERKMRIVLSTKDPIQNPKNWIAQIWDESLCQATCEVKSTEPETPFSPLALHMNCHSSGIRAFSAPVTVLWPERGNLRPQNAPTLRFGSWLTGYESAPLLVEKDRLSLLQHPFLKKPEILLSSRPH